VAVKDLVNLGISPDSGTGDSARRGGEKINTLFADLYAHFGDNPIGNDPNGPYYGYRRPFYEYEYKVGELHPAGKFTTVRFNDTTGTPYDATYGYGVDAGGAWVDGDGDGIPDIYRDSEWYFMTRGEAIGADLSGVSPGGVAHIVLPLAKAGDIIKIRDSFGTWEGKYISLWATPYDFQTTTQVTEWKANTPINNKVYPDSDSIRVNRADGTKFTAPFRRPVVPAAVRTAYPNLDQHFSTTTSPAGDIISPVSFFNKSNTEIEMMYRGADVGWVVKEKLLLSSFGQIDVISDIFEAKEWLQWDTVDLTVNIGGNAETEIVNGTYVLCVAPTSALGGRDINTSTLPAIKVFRRMTETTTDTSVLTQLNAWLGTKVVDQTLSGNARARVAAVYGQDSDGISWTNGFLHTDPANIYREVTLSTIVDTTGNIILLSQEPFDGYVQIFAPVS